MRTLLFSIDRLEFVGGGKALLGGRCYRGPIRTGDVARWMISGEGQEASGEPVALTFPEFQFYGTTLRELDAGLTAGLLIPSEVATGLRFGWLLKGEGD